MSKFWAGYHEIPRVDDFADGGVALNLVFPTLTIETIATPPAPENPIDDRCGCHRRSRGYDSDDFSPKPQFQLSPVEMRLDLVLREIGQSEPR
jgi:hypothetical protein